MDVRLESDLTCPACGATTRHTMPEDACVYFFDCIACNALIEPKQGDCCVFCSYGSASCPPAQAVASCCAIC